MLNRPSKAVVTRVVGIVGALVALSAFLVLSNVPGSVFGQETGVIMYAENGTAPVLTFTSEDPEGAGIHWDVTGVDANDFMISGGVLTFREPPNYEKPTDQAYAADLNNDSDTDDAGEMDAAENNIYHITVRASEMRASGYMGRALSTETDVIVQVTNRNEMGTVTLSRLQPEVATPITAMLDEPDTTTDIEEGLSDITWQWYISNNNDPVIDTGSHWILATGLGAATDTYTPNGDRVDRDIAFTPDPNAPVDENKVLRVVATYTDSLGDERMSRAVSTYPVRAEVSSDLDDVLNPANGSPGFSSQNDYTRTVSESLGKGMNVGAAVEATDPNFDTLTYELDSDAYPETEILTTDPVPDVSYFSINRATGQVMVKNTLDYDMKGTGADQGKYKFHVRAYDPSGEWAEVEVTVTVTDANDAPKIMGSRTLEQLQPDATPQPAIPEAATELRVMEEDSDDRDGNSQPDTMYNGMPDMPVPGVLGNLNVFTAPDDDERSQISWTLRGEDADDFERSDTVLSGPDDPIALRFKNAPDYEMPTDANGDSVYKVTLVADDRRGGVAMHHVTIFVDNLHEQGMVTLMADGDDPDQPVIGMKVAAMIDDPDGGVGVVTWQWAKSTDGINDFSVIPEATMYSYTPVAADTGRFLRVTATYIDTTSDMDDPDTGMRDERVQGGTPTDPDPQVATTGDGVHDLELDSDGDPVVSTDVGKVYRVMATTKNAVRVDPDETTQMTPVAFSEASYELTVVENAEVNTIVGGPVMAMGARYLKYDLDATETNDDAYFTIDNYGQIRVGEVVFPDVQPPGVMDVPMGVTAPPGMDDPELDFEGTNAFGLIVTATDTSDDTRKATARVTVRLSDLNERPYFDQESREAVTDGNSPIMYAESQSNRVVPLAATEPDGDRLLWEVTGADASAFVILDAEDIASDGKDRRELHFKHQPDFEDGKGSGALEDGTPNNNVYIVTVRATETTAVTDRLDDEPNPNMAAELSVMVQVTNSDEDGTVELNWLQPEVGTAITASISDPDGEVPSESWTWYRSKVSNPNRSPSIDNTDTAFISEWEMITTISGNPVPTDVTVLDNDTYTPQGDDASIDNANEPGDVAADEGWFLLGRVVYTDGTGATDRAAVGISANAVQADVSDADNNSPDYTLNEINRTVLESASKGTNVGRPVIVDRNEDQDTLTYELDDDNVAGNPLADGDVPTDVSFFSINKETGQIKVNGKLDWDKNPNRTNPDGKYEVWVRATDPSGEPDGEDSDDIKVIITATDVNEAPKITDGMAELSVNEVDSSKKDTDVTKYVGLGYEIAQGAAAQSLIEGAPNLYHRDEDDNVDSATWSISGADRGLFEHSTPGDGIGRRLHFKKANLPDYEDPQDANGDNVYEVTIVATDNANARGTKNVRITVNNVNELGKLVLTPEQPDDGMPVMATVTDPDGVESITDVKWASAPGRVADFEAAMLIEGATTLGIWGTGQVGNFLWAMVDYRDGYSMENDPVTALDERNDGPGTDGIFGTNDDSPIEQHKLQIQQDDTLFYNSDEMEKAVTDNAVQKDPGTGTGPGETPSTKPILMDRMVYENVPSTGYVGMPLGMLGTRDMIGGPDGASFVFAEDMDNSVDLNFYDMEMVESDDIAAVDAVPDADPPIEAENADDDSIDKMGQLAAAVVTRFDAEGDKTEYIVEVTDPDAVVAMGPVRVTITVMNVNEAPTAPMEQRGGLSVTGRENPPFNEILVDDTSPDLMVGTYRGIGVDAANAVWDLTGPDMDDFSIGGSTGVVTFRAAPNYEMPMDADTDNRYQITVVANDGTNGATLPVTVMVVNVDEDGTLTLSASATEPLTMAPQVGDTITGAVMDPDGGVTGESWQWSRTMTPDMMASWMDIDGETNAAYTVMEGDTDYYLRVMATYTDAVGTDMDMADSMPTMMVGAEAGDPLFGYDTSGNGRIDKDELAKAVLDYEINLTLEKPALADLILSYEIG